MSEKIKTLVAEIRSQLDEETRQKVGTLLTDVIGEYSTLSDNFETVKAESIKRKEKIRELSPQIEQFQDEIQTLKEQNNTEELETELNQLREFRKDYLKQQRNNFVNQFTKIKSHKNFEKAKSFFVLPEDNGKEEIDFSKVSDDDMEKNINKLTELNKLDYFVEEQERKGKPVGEKFNRQSDEKPEIKSRSDLQKSMKQSLEMELSKE